MHNHAHYALYNRAYFVGLIFVYSRLQAYRGVARIYRKGGCTRKRTAHEARGNFYVNHTYQLYHVISVNLVTFQTFVSRCQPMALRLAGSFVETS
jgi:hypothetical protein